MYSSKDSRIVVVPGEKKEVRLQCTLGSSMVKESKLDKIDSSDISLVYSFYPKGCVLYLTVIDKRLAYD